MKQYDISEDGGGRFATITARTPMAALRKALRTYPRKRCDYNVEPGEHATTVWRAHESVGPYLVSVEIPVPSRGAGRARWSGPAR